MRRAKIQHCRHGLTLVEFVIVMAIIAILVSFLLPQVHRGRYAARQTQCKNNLKQMGLALQNYHDTYNSFPAGYSLEPDGTYGGWGWGVSLLPYLDSRSTYEEISLQGGLQYEYRKPNLRTVLPAFVCPTEPAVRQIPHMAVVTSDVRNGQVVKATKDAAGMFVRSSYFGVVGYLPIELGGIEQTDGGETQPNRGRLGNVGSSFSQEGRYCDRRNFRGVFGQNSYLKMDEIKDGRSHTLMIGERYSPSNEAIGVVGHGTWAGVPDCTTAAGLAAALGDTSVKLNLGLKRRDETTGFGSFHTGGALFLMADGSVKFLNENISITTYRDLSTIDDGRQVGEF